MPSTHESAQVLLSNPATYNGDQNKKKRSILYIKLKDHTYGEFLNSAPSLDSLDAEALTDTNNT